MGNHRSSDAGLLETLAAEDETLRAGRKQAGTHSGEWLVNVAADMVVPMSTTELVDALRAGRLTNRSLVWRVGMHDWTALAEVPQLRLAAGPSALPPAAATPGPVIHHSPRPPEQRRRTTLPFGRPAVTAPHSESSALAVYERPAATLTFADSLRSDASNVRRAAAQQTPQLTPQRAPARVAPPAPPAPLSRPRLTPLPAVAARLPERVLHALPSNTLAPTTHEAESARPPPAPWGDLSVVLASELRAEKRATKRLVLWAALGSALVASLFTFWVTRGVPSARPPALATAEQAAPPRAPSPEPLNSAPSATPIAAAPAPLQTSSTPVPAVKPASPAVAVRPRAVARPKPKHVAASASTAPTADRSPEMPSNVGAPASAPSEPASTPSSSPDVPEAQDTPSAPPAAAAASTPPASTPPASTPPASTPPASTPPASSSAPAL